MNKTPAISVQSLINLFFTPHEKHNYRPHSLRPTVIFGYALFFITLQLILRLIPLSFPGVLGFASNITTEELINYTNRERLNTGLSALQRNPLLDEAARKKAEDMFAKDYWAHVNPDGVEPWYFITQAGYSYVYAGENLAKDFQDSEKVVDAWMASASHKANLLNPKYQEIGIATVNGTLQGYETTLVVQIFGSKSQLASKASVLPPAQSSSQVSGFPTEQPAPVLESEKISESGEKTPRFLTQEIKKSIPLSQIVTIQQDSLKFSQGLRWMGWNEAHTRPFVDVYSFTKGLSLWFAIIMLTFLAIDGYLVYKKGHLRFTGHNLAHGAVVLWSIGSILTIGGGSIL